jgi:hypothetical protein
MRRDPSCSRRIRLNAARFSTGFQEMELDFLAGQFDIFSVGDTECVFK